MPDPGRLYQFVGRTARVHLYTAQGQLLGALEGRVADVAAGVNVSRDAEREQKKDLVLLVDLRPVVPEGTEVPEDWTYESAGGQEGEGWFAVQDLEWLPEEGGDHPLLKGVQAN